MRALLEHLTLPECRIGSDKICAPSMLAGSPPHCGSLGSVLLLGWGLGDLLKTYLGCEESPRFKVTSPPWMSRTRRRCLFNPAIPKDHMHRATTLGKSCGPPQNLAEPRRTLEETPAEASKNPSQRQISSQTLAEGCAPRMVTLWNFKRSANSKFWVRISSGGVRVFHVKGWGPTSSECPRETKTFWRDVVGSCRDILGAPEKFGKKGLCLIFGL